MRSVSCKPDTACMRSVSCKPDTACCCKCGLRRFGQFRGSSREEERLLVDAALHERAARARQGVLGVSGRLSRQCRNTGLAMWSLKIARMRSRRARMPWISPQEVNVLPYAAVPRIVGSGEDHASLIGYLRLFEDYS